VASKGATLARKRLSVALAVIAALFLLGLFAWVFDPPLRSKLIEGSIVRWQWTEIGQDGTTLQHTAWFLVKLDDGRTVGVASQRAHWPTAAWPTEGERVLVQERIGLLGSRRFYDMRLN
jgi:hypothetical protein